MRAGALATALLLAGCGDACAPSGSVPVVEAPAPPTAPGERPRKRGRPKARPDAPTLVLVVIDTVRADHMSLCGYGRPTTPYLETLGKRAGPVTYTCGAVSPGTWTIPSHASMFTGRTVAEHGSDAVERPMSDALPTLAEELGARGYQSLLVSANPTLSKRSGLQRGFDEAVVARNLDTWRGPAFEPVLRNALERLDRDRPLFLVANLIDAHDPFPEIPLDVAWLTPRPSLPYDPHDAERDEPYHRFLRGELPAAEAKAFREAVVDGYDYGIARADQNVAQTLAALRAAGWLEGPFRVVITSDHGEFLGEKGLLRHGCYPWEPVTRVPLMVYEPGRPTPLVLPELVSGAQVFHLLRDGELADDVPVLSASEARVREERACADAVAWWPGPGRKVIAAGGTLAGFDLGSDPGEDKPGAVSAGEGEVVRPFVEAHAVHREATRGVAGDEERRREMEALGYVE